MSKSKDLIRILCFLMIISRVLYNAECYSQVETLFMSPDTLAPKIHIYSPSFKNDYLGSLRSKVKNNLTSPNNRSIKSSMPNNTSTGNNFLKGLGRKLIAWIRNIKISQDHEELLPSTSFPEKYKETTNHKQEILECIKMGEHSELYHLKMFGKDIWVLGDEHRPQTLDIARRHVLSKINIEEKNDWVFLVEGDLENRELLRDNPEIKGVYDFAKTHDIDIIQAVTSNVDEKVTELFLLRNLGDRSELFLGWFSATCNGKMRYFNNP